MAGNYVTKETCKALHNALKEDVDEIKSDIKVIKNNHLVHLNHDVAVVKTYLKILGGALTVLLPAVISILLKVFYG